MIRAGQSSCSNAYHPQANTLQQNQRMLFPACYLMAQVDDPASISVSLNSCTVKDTKLTYSPKVMEERHLSHLNRDTLPTTLEAIPGICQCGVDMMDMVTRTIMASTGTTPVLRAATCPAARLASVNIQHPTHNTA